MASLGKMLLELPGVGKVRRVHALEHATITILSHRFPEARMAGRSTPKGFWFYGDVDEYELERAVHEALRRLQSGEAQLAIHPRCGTNLAVAGLLTGAAGLLASTSLHRDEGPLDKLPRVVLATMAALFVAQPAGLAVQEAVTTSPDASSLLIGKIRHNRSGRLPIAFVEVLG